MSDPELEIRGVVLHREETGENFLRLTLFGPQGLRRCLLRKVRKLTSILPPDLFDETEIALQKNNSQGLSFAREHLVLQKRMPLALDRTRFDAAGFLARFYIENGEHLLDAHEFYRILQNALSSLEDHGHPPTVLLKTLFLFAREEGLPVKESWFSGLSAEFAGVAQSILRLPVKESSNLNDQAPVLLDSLSHWLRSETELRC